MARAHENLIGGKRRPAESGATFELAAHASSFGTWPRSSAADVAAAIASAGAASSTWNGLAHARRREILERAASELAADPDPGGLLAGRLGLEPGELAHELRSLPPALDLALREPFTGFASRRIAEEGLLLFAPAWSELLASSAAALFSALLLGRTVLFVTDPHAPMIGDAVSAALERAGLDAGVLSIVHDDRDDALRAAIASGAATYTRASGHPTRVRRLERLVTGGVRTEFGAGVERSLAPALDLRILRNRTAVFRAAEDPEERVVRFADEAFGRSKSLSGQLPGQLARVVCPERSFSRFSEALIAHLRRSPDLARPVPLVEKESEDHLRRVRVLGLDEGATLIFDGEDFVPKPAADGAETVAPHDSPENGLGAILSPTVFTNVEERMRLALLGRPAPLLCLLRVESDEAADALAQRLDRDLPAEDLVLDAEA
ncbi:MAG TPA: aldehyde dehydrogenase family protein [Planctomycetota bacterium]|nr:aldehyde dehydrogenase family protein [Planctomycetota bacterium]